MIDAMLLNDPAKKNHASVVTKFTVNVSAEYGVHIDVKLDFGMEDHICFLDEVSEAPRLYFVTRINPACTGRAIPARHSPRTALPGESADGGTEPYIFHIVRSEGAKLPGFLKQRRGDV